MNRPRLVLSGVLCAFVLPAVPASAQECAGPFWAAESLEVFKNPRESVVADFNGDGYPDVAVTTDVTNVVRVFLRSPSGDYTSQVYGTVGPFYQADDLAADDVDGDGDVDLAVVNFGLTFTVLENDGAGVFTVAQTVAKGFGSGDLVFGDLDGVVIIPRKVEAEVIEKALEKARGEKTVLKAIQDGMSTVDAFAKYGIM